MDASSPLSDPSRALAERNLLDLFAPADFMWLSGDQAQDPDATSLWRLDAIHRARNLAQLAASVARLTATRPDFASAGDTAATSRALARAYEALSVDCGAAEPVPCFELMSEVASKLVQIFASGRGIELTIAGHEVHLAADRRRALILICSELVINALKYAFPVRGPGRLSVSLTRVETGILLVVEDNGHGLTGDAIPGSGSGLIDRLAANSDARLIRTTGQVGAGLRAALLLQPEDTRSDAVAHPS